MDRNNFIYKVEAGFIYMQSIINDFKEFFSMDIDDMVHFLNVFYYNIDDFNYELFEFELRIRALRDKINESEVL